MGVGAVALIVIFQQEIRRFLLFVGKSTAFANNRLLGRFFRQATPTDKINELKLHHRSREGLCHQSLREGCWLKRMMN